MDSSKVLIIYGEDNLEKQIEDGKIEQKGNIFEKTFHSVHLLELANEKYPQVEIFKILKYTHTPETIAFFFTKLGNIVFLNTTKNDKQSGSFIMPQNITEKQKQSLYFLSDAIKNFNIGILYDLKLVDGLMYDEEDFIDGSNLKEWLNNYFNKTKLK